MVQTSKPERANTFIIEYSLPGTLRSKLDCADSEEPCTRTSTGSGLLGPPPKIAGPFAIHGELHAAFIGPVTSAPNIAARTSFGLGERDARTHSGANGRS